MDEKVYVCVMKVGTFDTEEKARKFSELLIDAFCSMDEAEGLFAINKIETDTYDEIYGNDDDE